MFRAFTFFVIVTSLNWENACCERSFLVDINRGVFLRDGEPFRYVSGTVHYFRIPRESWNSTLYKLRVAGLNAVQTYIEWRSHEPYQGQYRFGGNLDVVAFLKAAQAVGLLVILRPGPYIDAERDMGGLPSWLLHENPEMKLRTSDPSYIKFVDRWFSVLLPKLKPLIYANGGPIISVQVENEYGSVLCDKQYLSYLRDTLRSYLKPSVLLFSVDGPSPLNLVCGNINGVFATVDFGPGENITKAFDLQLKQNGGGPLVNSEYYSGWLDHWGYPHYKANLTQFLGTMKEMLDANASINIYVFHGGTNFGYSAGSNLGEKFQAVPTSYDYDAPLTEAGDTTYKYFLIRKLLKKYLPPYPAPAPFPELKYEYDPVQLSSFASLFDVLPFVVDGKPVFSRSPLTFEALGQSHGFVLYEVTVNTTMPDPTVLRAPHVHDRGYVFIDQIFAGILDRGEKATELPIFVLPKQKIQILVENQGRVCFGDIKDFKGILGNVTLGKTVLQPWTIYRIPLEQSYSFENTVKAPKDINVSLPAFFFGSFIIPNKTDLPLDTYLIPDGWTKGLVAINGFLLGRYWPVMGPQVSLYVPKTILKPYPQMNVINVFELERAACLTNGKPCLMKFSYKPIIDGNTPYKNNKQAIRSRPHGA